MDGLGYKTSEIPSISAIKRINSLHLKDAVGRQVAGLQYNGKSIQSLREIGFMCRNRSGVHRSVKAMDERNDRGIQ